MKNYIGNIQTLLIIVLGIVIFFMRSCDRKPVITEPQIITNVEVVHDTINREVPVYVPKYITKVVHDIDTFSTPIDTSAILSDYFSTYVYEDVQNLDSLILTITDSITENSVKNRSIKYQLIYPTTTITKEIYLNKNEFYYGFGLQGTSKQLNYVGGELLLRRKNKKAFGIGIGVNQDFTPVLSGKFYWKIGK